MTKTAIRRELRNVKTKLDWLLWREQAYDPDWSFRSQPQIPALQQAPRQTGQDLLGAEGIAASELTAICKHPAIQSDSGTSLSLLCSSPFQCSFVAGALGGKCLDDDLPFHDKGFQFLAREGLFHQLVTIL